MTYSPHVVKARDVQIAQHKNKMMFMLRSSKTHTKVDMPQIVKIESIKKISGTTKQAQAGGRFCTFTLLKEYVRVRQGFATNDE